MIGDPTPSTAAPTIAPTSRDAPRDFLRFWDFGRRANFTAEIRPRVSFVSHRDAARFAAGSLTR